MKKNEIKVNDESIANLLPDTIMQPVMAFQKSRILLMACELEFCGAKHKTPGEMRASP